MSPGKDETRVCVCGYIKIYIYNVWYIYHIYIYIYIIYIYYIYHIYILYIYIYIYIIGSFILRWIVSQVQAKGMNNCTSDPVEKLQTNGRRIFHWTFTCGSNNLMIDRPTKWNEYVSCKKSTEFVYKSNQDT